VYRSWTVPSHTCVGSAGLEEPVLGLRDLLRSAGLSSFREMIEEWCEAAGAAFLSDIASNDEVVEALLEAWCAWDAGICMPAIGSRTASVDRLWQRERKRDRAPGAPVVRDAGGYWQQQELAVHCCALTWSWLQCWLWEAASFGIHVRRC